MPLLDEEHARKRQRALQKRREKANIELHPQRWAWLRFDADVLGTPGRLEHGKLYRRKETEANNVWWDLVDQEEAVEELKRQKAPVRVIARIKEKKQQKKREVFNATPKVIFAFTPESPFHELEKKEA